MSTRVVGKNARLYLKELQIYLRLFEMEQGMESSIAEGSVYNDDLQSFEIIDAMSNFSLNGRFDADGLTSEQDPNLTLDTALFSNLFIDNFPLLFLPDGDLAIVPSANYLGAFYGNYVSGGVSIAMPRSDLGSIRLNARSDGRIVNGHVMAVQDVALVSGVDTFLPGATGLQMIPAVPAGTRIAAVWHMWKKTGAGNVQAQVQGATSGAGPFTDRAAFTTRNLVGGEFIDVADANDTEDFHRIRIQSSATETVSVAFASMRV